MTEHPASLARLHEILDEFIHQKNLDPNGEIASACLRLQLVINRQTGKYDLQRAA